MNLLLGFIKQKSSYRTLASYLKEFEQIDSLPLRLKKFCESFITVEELFEELVRREAVFHKSCSTFYNKQKLERKRKSLSKQVENERDELSNSSIELPRKKSCRNEILGQEY